MIPFAKTFVDLDSTSSTSDHAREAILAGEPELPLVVRARTQTAGRGRGEHHWWSDAGSLTFTVAFDPLAFGLRTEYEPRVALAVAVTLIEAMVERFGMAGKLGIRWPNDVEASGKKVAGILPERIETDRGVRLLIGIGINVASRLDAAPDEVRRMATSLLELSRRSPDDVDSDTLFVAVLDRLSTTLTNLAADDAGQAGNWSRLDALIGQPVRLVLGGSTISGTAMGIEPSGGLLIASEGRTQAYHAGQVLR